MTKTNRTGMVVVAVAAAVLMALTLVSMATGHLYFVTKAMAFVMPILAFVELDVLCKLLYPFFSHRLPFPFRIYLQSFSLFKRVLRSCGAPQIPQGCRALRYFASAKPWFNYEQIVNFGFSLSLEVLIWYIRYHLRGRFSCSPRHREVFRCANMFS